MSSFGRGLQLGGLAAQGQARNRQAGQSLATNQLAIERDTAALDEMYAAREAAAAQARAASGAAITPMGAAGAPTTTPFNAPGQAGTAPTAPVAAGGVAAPARAPAPAAPVAPSQSLDFNAARQQYLRAIEEQKGIRGREATTNSLQRGGGMALDLATMPGRGLLMLGEKVSNAIGSGVNAITGRDTLPTNYDYFASQGTYPFLNAANAATADDRARFSDATAKIGMYRNALTEIDRMEQAQGGAPGVGTPAAPATPQQFAAPAPAAPMPAGLAVPQMPMPQTGGVAASPQMSGTLMSAPGTAGGAQLRQYDQVAAQIDAQLQALQPYVGQSAQAQQTFFALMEKKNTLALGRGQLMLESALSSGDVGTALGTFNQMTGGDLQVASIGPNQYVFARNGQPIDKPMDGPTLVSNLRMMSDKALQAEAAKYRFELYKEMVKTQGQLAVAQQQGVNSAATATITANAPKLVPGATGGYVLAEPMRDSATIIPDKLEGKPTKLPSGESVPTLSQPQTFSLGRGGMAPRAAGGLSPVSRDTNENDLLQ